MISTYACNLAYLGSGQLLTVFLLSLHQLPARSLKAAPQISQNDLSTMAPTAAAVAVAAATTVPIAIVGSRLAKMIGQRFVVIETVPSQTDLPTWILSPPS